KRCDVSFKPVSLFLVRHSSMDFGIGGWLARLLSVPKKHSADGQWNNPRKAMECFATIVIG
ncbi:MAG TPA: hypothetical protein VFY06_03855, partial [Verrucomicrobiae bacterium]|nr:hypothetical protein [Verrucomicrobiae bacterium]